MNAFTHTSDDEIRIYVADLAAYNAGDLHGIWIDATQELEDIQDQINTMLKASPVEDAEEYAIHDYDGFAGCNIYEYDGLELVHEKAVFIEERGELGARLLAHTADDIEEAKRILSEDYHGCFETLADYAREFTEDTSTVPEHLKNYIDYEKMARDFECGDVYTIKTAHEEIHVFSNY
jgi:antirestriction protein